MSQSTKSLRTPKLDVPRITVFDLWYTAHQERGVDFTFAALEGDTHDDWLMRNMALVVYGVVYGRGLMKGSVRYAGQLVDSEGPYGIRVAFNNNRQTLRVALFLMEDEDGNHREQGTADQDT